MTQTARNTRSTHPVYGFEFLVEHPCGKRTWERIHGAGGFIGDGTLYQFSDGAEPSHVHCAALLSHARRWTRQRANAVDGIRVLVNADAPPAERFTTIHGATLHACRPLRTIADVQIRQLRGEAGSHGDAAQVSICDAALAGDASAWAECARVIREARAARRGA